MPQYTDQQYWITKAFRGHRTCCVLDCDCGRVHFVSAAGHGDYEEGELAEFQQKAKDHPDKYYEHNDFDYVETVVIDGREIVPDCPCGKIQRYIDWIEENADSLAKYLGFHFEHRKKELARQQQEAESLAAGIQQ